VTKPPSTAKRRRHEHFLVTILYRDGGRFSRVYLDRRKAEAFAKRQMKSPPVKKTAVRKIR
jgi:hypothetical protein